MTASNIKSAIDSYCQATYNDGHRTHLGASQIGNECSRHLWYQFRHAHDTMHDGRMYRLFQRGHLEESRIVEYLEGIGFTVNQFDPYTGDQHRISDINGHFGGSCDGIISMREEIQAKYNLPTSHLLLECKTSSTGKPFDDLALGVRQSKPQHYAQMCIYGKYLNLTHALYIVVNKNDDDLYIEIVELNDNYANSLTEKADAIINAPTPPSRLSETPTYYKCKWCTSYKVCHNQEIEPQPLNVNCRTCVHSMPGENATWYCNLYADTIPHDVEARGCGGHEQIINK